MSREWHASSSAICSNLSSPLNLDWYYCIMFQGIREKRAASNLNGKSEKLSCSQVHFHLLLISQLLFLWEDCVSKEIQQLKGNEGGRRKVFCLVGWGFFVPFMKRKIFIQGQIAFLCNLLDQCNCTSIYYYFKFLSTLSGLTFSETRSYW